MRILYVINSLLPGGAEAVVAQWATYLQRKGHLVDVCTIYTKGQFGKQLERQGTIVHNLALDPGIERFKMRRKYDLRVVLPLARLVQDGSYDIVHAHLFPTSLFVALALFFAKRQPCIFSEHSVLNRRRRFRPLKLLDLAIYHRYAQIVAVSEEVRQSLVRWLPRLKEKVQVVPNTIDPDQFSVSELQVCQLRQELDLRTESKVILFAGRMEHPKGVDILLEAVSCLSIDEKVPIRVLIAGDGPLKNALQQQAVPLGEKVTFLGSRTDIPLLLNLADLVVIPSRWEGLPMILLEAMASQTPVLAADVGGIPDVIEHGVNGWLIPPENPPAFAEGINLLIQSDDLCKRLSSNALQTLRTRYSPEVTIKKLLDIYHGVLQNQAINEC